MLVYEFGKQNNKKIVLLHGGGLSWWNYQEVAHLLEKEYHVILPVLDGHADSEDAFISIEENAKRIIQYIQMHFNGKVDLIGGLSLGAQIVVEILSQKQDICDFAIVESALLLPMKFTNKSVQSMLDMSYGLIAKPWFAKLQFKSLKIKADLYDMYYQDTCKITKENMIAFLKANTSYTLKESIVNTKAKVCIYVGEKEDKTMQKSAYLLHDKIKNSTLEIKAKLYHGEFSINHACKYANTITSLLKDM